MDDRNLIKPFVTITTGQYKRLSNIVCDYRMAGIAANMDDMIDLINRCSENQIVWPDLDLRKEVFED